MPIEGIYWDWEKRAMEVHVLEGTTSPDLRVAHLRFEKRNADNDLEYPFAKAYLDDGANHKDVTLTFTIADASAAPGTSTRSFAARKITLKGDTGEVTVKAPLATDFPQNFLLEVQAVSGTNKFRELIRVHVHRKVKDLWLTPRVLTVRPRRADTLPVTTKSRFALRARFDDETVGDITDWPGIDWKPTRSVDPKGQLKVNAGDVGSPIEITARIAAFPNPAKAKLQIVDPWKPEQPIQTRIIPGGGLPGASAIEAVPNVLFLSDGFTSKSVFMGYVTALVAFVRGDKLCHPFTELVTSINFWAAFVPPNPDPDHPGVTPPPGITWGSEVLPKMIRVELAAPNIIAVNKPKRPHEDPPGTIWDVDRLIYEVGLPTPAERNRSGRENDKIVKRWKDLFGTTVADHLPTKVDDLNDLVDIWRELGFRRILDDVDTPLGLMSGAPRVDFRHNLLALNPDRMNRARLDDLMAVLQDENAQSGLQINTLWTDRRKRNYDLICIVTTEIGREINSFGYFVVSQQAILGMHFGDVTGINDLVPDPTVTRVKIESPSESRTFVHELSHSFDLGDEYGGSNDRPLFRPTQELVDRTEGNLQSPFSLQQAGVISGDEIKWRWPRITWAAEITGAITDRGSGVFEAPVRWRHAFAFPIGKTVHLRFRNIDFAFRDKDHDGVHFDQQSAYLIKLPLVSVPLKLVDVFESGTPLVKNVRLSVDASVPFDYPNKVLADRIVATFTPGSIVYQATRAPAGAFDAAVYPYAELIAKNVKEGISARHATLGHTLPESAMPEIPDFTGITLRAGFPSDSLPLIVGLYDGGMGNDSGMFHPTGNCVMNNHVKASLFCHVCKYVLVDAIDPSKHYFLDPGYDAIYPQA